jgi:hypothetical protein
MFPSLLQQAHASNRRKSAFSRSCLVENKNKTGNRRKNITLKRVHLTFAARTSKNIKYSEFLFAALSYHHTRRTRGIILSSGACRLYQVFTSYLTKGKIFRKISY